MIAIIAEAIALVVLSFLVATFLMSSAPYLAVPFAGCWVLVNLLLFTDVRKYQHARMRNLRK